VALTDYTRTQLIKRSIMMTIGVLIMGLGVAISKLALLGTTPISTIPAVLSFATTLTIGTWTILFNILIIALEIAILGRKSTDITTFLQMVVAILLGIFTDLGVEIFSGIVSADNYALQWAWCIIACIVLAFGVNIEIHANLLVAPGDGMVMALKLRKPEIPFSRLKVLFDSSNVIIAAIISFILMGELNGVREGTVFAAIAVGIILGRWNKLIGPFLDRIVS